MISEESRTVATKAKSLYESLLRHILEKDHAGKFASIEPISGRYFLGDTLDQAVNAALDVFPDRLTYTVRVGHSAALHIGELVS